MDGGATVTARGVCWSTSQNPTISDAHTTDGSGIGSYTSSIINLTPYTIYYVRAYAINSSGTAYGNIISFKTGTVIDIEGNVYNTITIGDQVWMVENLKTTKYNDGSQIYKVNYIMGSNITTGAYCWYSYDSLTHYNTYGALYNWYAVNTGKLCPAGWHVPTHTEWLTLTDYLGGEDIAGGKLKETGTEHWHSPNTGATNESRFTALPGGSGNFRAGFQQIGEIGLWWSSTEYSGDTAWDRGMSYLNEEVSKYDREKVSFNSVRCVKNNK